jgi:iron complex outermembrane receptor protein
MRRLVVGFATSFIALPLLAQEPVRTDTTGRDTTRVTELPELEVTVTRTPEPQTRVPFATGVLDRRDIQRGQQTVGIDEALNNIPGVVVANRYNFSLDQRISIRGFGSRSNFGVRGLKILLDGIPQTLPDGQSQLTNVDFADLGRAEVLRGSSSSLYGNASGGVISLQTQGAEPGPFAQKIRVQGGGGEREGDGFYKWQSWTSARSGAASGTLSISQFKADGFRQHSAGDFRLLNAGLDYTLGGSTLGTLRLGLADSPEAQNPGALTMAEYLANPDSAAANNIRRGADKDVQQYQLALGLKHYDAASNEYELSVFGLTRDLKNPLAAPVPGGTPTQGTYVDIDRLVGGVRGSMSRKLGAQEKSPRLTAGADLQLMRDDRLNLVQDAGIPTSTVLLDQREKVAEIGPFAQMQWSPTEPLLLSAGARYDWVQFSLADNFLADGDDSGDRTMSAASGNIGASWAFGEQLIPYVNISTSFETPTTTELVNQPDGSGGFNQELGPQRALNYEIGARGRPLRNLEYTVSLFLGRITDAIVQQEEIGGRAFFRNEGKTHNDGAEIGLTYSPVEAVTLRGGYTRAHYRFVGGDFDGNRLPGVPDHFWRFGLRTALPRGFFVDADHTLTSSVAADDANTIIIDSWGAGVTNLRLGWDGSAGVLQIGPFVGLNNMWDRQYIGSVTLNGAGGRVIEPSPRRVIYVGAEIGYRATVD